MGEWRAMLGPFLIWATHFTLVYGIASVADIGDQADVTRWRDAGLVLTAACLIGMVLQVWIFVQPARSPLSRSLCVTGAAIGFFAVAWQSLPLLIAS